MQTDDAKQVEDIVILPDRRSLRSTILIVIMLVWWIQGAVVIREVLTKMPRNWHVPVLLLLLLWFAGTALLLSLMAWFLLGATVASFADNNLTIYYKISSMPIRHSEPFVTDMIRHMRIEQRLHKTKGNASVTYAIVFDYRDSKYDLFSYLPQQQAEALLQGSLKRFA